MTHEISLLPEEQRKKEEALMSSAAATPAPSTELQFSVPKEEGDDIEVIEIDEGEIEQVLESEPALTRFIYKATSFFDELKDKVFQPREEEPPPKLPPQFFKPPVGKPATAPAPAVAGAPVVAATPTAPGVPSSLAAAPAFKTKAQVKPFQAVPRRVRVIKRVRKPVRVSFVTESDLQLMRIDIPRRKFTLAVLVVLFGVLVGGSAYALNNQATEARGELAKADAQLAQVRSEIQTQLKDWNSFQNLEPKLRALAGLLDAHVSPMHLLEQIERTTLGTVTYQSFSLSPDKRVTLFTSADGFDTAASQVAAFQRADFVKKVEASGYTAAYDPPDAARPKSVEFQMILTLSDDILRVTPTVAAAP